MIRERITSEAKFLKKFCFIYVSKGVIWASEYSLGPQCRGPGGPRPLGPPLDLPLLEPLVFNHWNYTSHSCSTF